MSTAPRASERNVRNVAAAARFVLATAAFFIASVSGCGEATPPASDGGGGGDWDGSDASTEDSPEEQSALPDGPIDEAACRRIVNQAGCATRCGCASCPVESVKCFLDPDCRAIVECLGDHGCLEACPACEGVLALHLAGTLLAINVSSCFVPRCGSACACPGCDVTTDRGSDAPAVSDADAASGEEIDGTADGFESGGSSLADDEGDDPGKPPKGD